MANLPLCRTIEDVDKRIANAKLHHRSPTSPLPLGANAARTQPRRLDAHEPRRRAIHHINIAIVDAQLRHAPHTTPSIARAFALHTRTAHDITCIVATRRFAPCTCFARLEHAIDTQHRARTTPRHHARRRIDLALIATTQFAYESRKHIVARLAPQIGAVALLFGLNRPIAANRRHRYTAIRFVANWLRFHTFDVAPTPVVTRPRHIALADALPNAAFRIATAANQRTKYG